MNIQNLNVNSFNSLTYYLFTLIFIINFLWNCKKINRTTRQHFLNSWNSVVEIDCFSWKINLTVLFSRQQAILSAVVDDLGSVAWRRFLTHDSHALHCYWAMQLVLTQTVILVVLTMTGTTDIYWKKCLQQTLYYIFNR